MTNLISEAKQVIETKQLLFQYDKDLHLLIGLVERLEIAERQREEAVKALEEIKKDSDQFTPHSLEGANNFAGWTYHVADEALKRIKGENGQ